MIKKLVVLLFSLMMVVSLVGCSLLNNNNNNNQPAISSITVVPGEPFVVVNHTQQFTASAWDVDGDTVSASFNWSVTPSNMGTITQAGLFTAGSTTGNCTVTCISGTKSGTASVTIVPLPESADLHQAGEQIIDDTQTVWGKLSPKMNSLYATLMESDIPDMNYASNAIYDACHQGVDLSLYRHLFQFDPGTYSTGDIYEGTPATTDWKEGTWTVHDDFWSTDITRTVNVDNDEIHFEITCNFDPALNYQGDVVYPTLFLDNPYLDSISGSLEITMTDENIDSATVSGAIDFDQENVKIFMNGDLDFQFKDDNYLNFQGELSLQHSADQQDYFDGSFETANILINGELTVDYVANANIEDILVFPNKLTVHGSIQDKSTEPMILDSELTIEVLNAAIFNPLEDYSATNWAHGILGFDGSIQIDANNSFNGSLTLEETAYERYSLDVYYQLTNEGEMREINLIIYNPNTTELHLEINSSWGPALVIMDAEFIDSIETGEISDVSGNIYVYGIEVGTISLSLGMIRVEYNDGTFETF